MSDVEQMTAGPTGNEATIAAMADVLAAIGSDGGIIEWAEEDEAVSPAPTGQPAPASGATIAHGPIRLRDSAPPTLDAGADTGEPDPGPPEVVGEGPGDPAPATLDAGDVGPDPGPPEVVGDGADGPLDSAPATFDADTGEIEPGQTAEEVVGDGASGPRDSAPATLDAGEPDPASHEAVGHDPIRLRDRPAEPAAGGDDGDDGEPDEAPSEAVGHGRVRLVDHDGWALPDMTPIAVADILDALDAVPPE